MTFVERHEYLEQLQKTPQELTEEESRRIGEFYRAGGDCLCDKCGKKFYDHEPYMPSAKTTTGNYAWLRELCNGDLVKL